MLPQPLGLYASVFALEKSSKDSVGQVHYAHLDLQDIVQRSQHVLVVRPDEPSAASEMIQFSDSHPSYHRRLTCFVVEAVLTSASAALVGAHIRVDEADLEWKKRMHRDYYERGFRKSPLHDAYTAKKQVGPADTRIVFLSGEPDSLAYVVEDAEEHVSHSAEVKKLVAQKESDGDYMIDFDTGERISMEGVSIDTVVEVREVEPLQPRRKK